MYVPKNAETRAYHAESKRQACADHLTYIAKRLREMADKIEHDRDDGNHLTPVHELMWGLANLNVETLAAKVAEANAFEAIQAALDGADGEEARAELAEVS